MKKINLLIILLLVFLNLSAQQVPINNIVNISLPKEAEKLTNLQLLSFVKGKAAYYQLKDRICNCDFYKINTMILVLIGFTVIHQPNYIEEAKKGADGLANLDGNLPANYTSEIKSINNYKALITHWEAQYYAYYNFTIVNNSNTSQLNGTLNYDKSDTCNRAKAIVTLDNLLKSMTFK